MRALALYYSTSEGRYYFQKMILAANFINFLLLIVFLFYPKIVEFHDNF